MVKIILNEHDWYNNRRIGLSKTGDNKIKFLLKGDDGWYKDDFLLTPEKARKLATELLKMAK